MATVNAKVDVIYSYIKNTTISQVTDVPLASCRIFRLS